MMSNKALRACSLALALVLSAAAFPGCSQKSVEPAAVSVPSGTIRVDIDTKSTGAKLDGFGAEFDPFFWIDSNNELNEDDWKILETRVKDMRLQKIRMMILPEWYEPKNDDADPNHVNDAAFQWDTQYMKSVFRELDLAEANHIKVDITIWGAYTGGWSWLANDRSHLWISAPNNFDEWSENITVLLRYLLDEKKYTCIKSLTPQNEPDSAFLNAQDKVVFDEYKTMYLNLDARLKKEGLRDKITLNASDDGTKPEWLLQSIKELGGTADIFDSHMYKYNAEDSDPQIYSYGKTLMDYVKKFASGKPFTYNEFGTNQYVDSHHQTDIDDYSRGLFYARLANNLMNSGASGMLAWVLFDEYYLTRSNKMTLGLWKYKDENWEARPIYYSWSLITRYTKVGSEIFAGKSDNDDITCSAYLSPEKEWTYLITNNTGSEQKLSVVNTAKGPKTLTSYLFEESTLPKDAGIIRSNGQIAVQDKVIPVVIPAQSFLVLTNVA